MYIIILRLCDLIVIVLKAPLCCVAFKENLPFLPAQRSSWETLVDHYSWQTQSPLDVQAGAALLAQLFSLL